jgi:DNA-binding YbaB/EbfC family protein
MNIAKLMQQAQKMQAGLTAAQEELAKRTVDVSVANGKVLVTATCAGDIVSLRIDPSVVDPTDVDFLQDLILKAVQDAINKGREISNAEMKKHTGGLPFPGM